MLKYVIFDIEDFRFVNVNWSVGGSRHSANF